MTRIPFAVVGLGYGAHWLESERAHPGREYFTLTAVCDRDPTRARQVAERWGVPACSELDQVLADPAVRVVALFTGPAGRAALIARCLAAGKHVLTTKPLELDAEAALTVLRQAQSLGLAVHLNSPSPVWPTDLALIREWEARFDLGRPIAAETASWHGGAAYERADGSWYDDPALCPVAPILRIGIYALNDLVRVWGEVKTVHVFEARRVTGRPTPDSAVASLRLVNGALVSIFASLAVGDGDVHENRLTLHYERGTVYRNIGPRPTAYGRAVLQLAARGMDGGLIDERVEVAHPSGTYDLRALARAVRGEPLQNALTPEDYVAPIHLIAALARASNEGPTDCEEFH